MGKERYAHRNNEMSVYGDFTGGNMTQQELEERIRQARKNRQPREENYSHGLTIYDYKRMIKGHIDKIDNIRMLKIIYGMVKDIDR